MRTQLMGILNITPDSFSDGGEYYDNIKMAVAHAKQLVKDGADIIDIGGESTRPGSEHINTNEELRRVLPVISAIKKELPHVKLSIDTWKHEVADEAMQAGCHMINSLGGFSFDKQLATVVAKYDCPIIMYHIKGNPKSMQHGAIEYTDIIKDITNFFEEQIAIGKEYGVQKEQFILDPGIGFGKTIDQNIEILKTLKVFTKLNLPVALGVSRKSHLGAIIQTELGLKDIPSSTERLEGSLAETAIAVQNGASIIRTHDVIETKKFLAVLERFNN
jgi:dihydropteroate synthase